MKKIKLLKAENKRLAALIKESRRRYKEYQRSDTSTGYWQWCSENKAWLEIICKEYRHKHIAYCLLRGRKYEEVENYVKPGNAPQWAAIEEIMEEYQDEPEDVCTGS